MPVADAPSAPLYSLNLSQFESLLRANVAKIVTEVMISMQPIQEPEPPDEIYLEEVATLTGRSTSSIYRKTSLRQIPYSKRGKQLIFSRKAIKEWMNNLTVDIPLVAEVADSHLQAEAEKRERRA